MYPDFNAAHIFLLMLFAIYDGPFETSATSMYFDQTSVSRLNILYPPFAKWDHKDHFTNGYDLAHTPKEIIGRGKEVDPFTNNEGPCPEGAHRIGNVAMSFEIGWTHKVEYHQLQLWCRHSPSGNGGNNIE